MRARLALMAALVAAFAFLGMAPSQAGGSSDGCYATPNPVILNQPWSLTAYGLTPDATYWVNVTQAKDSSNGAHPNGSLTTDATGTGTVQFPNTSWAPDAILGVGTAKARVYPFDEISPDAKGTVSCWFDITLGV